MPHSKTVLIIAPNDAEAILIKKLAEALGLSMIASKQTHGASLDRGRDYVRLVKEGGFMRAVIVEMPGIKTEKRLRALGVKLSLIDHHHYKDLDRAHDSQTGKMLPSSLEQFLRLFHLTKTRLQKMGFDPKLVLGIGIQDRGYIWALQNEGYTRAEIKNVMRFHDELIAPLLNQKTEKRKQAATERAWERRKRWRDFFVIQSAADVQLRPRISEIVARTIGKPTPLIIVERARGLIYVQESSYALHLFERFGGFTFGLDRNWGYRNEKGKKRVTLKDVKHRILEWKSAKK